MDAPPGSVESAQTDELERLQRRAYGPGADIAGDAAAQARLSELEAAQHRQLTPLVDSGASGSAPVPGPAPLPELVEGSRFSPESVREAVDGTFAGREPTDGLVTEQDPAGAPVVDSDRLAGAAATPWWRRRRFLIFGIAIAALVLNVAVVGWMSQLLADGSSPIPTGTATAEMQPFPAAQGSGFYVPAPDYVLALRSDGVDVDEPNDLYGVLDVLGISREGLRRYEDFHGPDGGNLNIWSGESRFGMTCLFVAVPVQGIRNGFSGDACSQKGLDTIVDVQKGGDSLTRFVLRGDQVNVYVYEGAADPNASRD